MNPIIHKMKLACITYTSAPITYKDKQYTL